MQDPLAKARDEWNKGLKDEYLAKFNKWTTLKRQAEKSGTSTGNYSNNFYYFKIRLLLY